MKKQFLLAVLVLALCLGLWGCQSRESIQLQEYGSTQTVGMEQAEQNINLKDISIRQNGDNQVLTLSFIRGDRNSGVDEARLDSVPKMTIRCLDTPYRYAIEIENVAYCSAFSESEWEPRGAILGLFHTNATQQHPFTLYVQLNSAASFDLSASGNQAVLTVQEGRSGGSTSYYAYVSAFQEFRAGQIPQGLEDMTPTFCQDGIDRKMLISKPFSTEQAAEDYADQAQKLLDGQAAGKQVSVIALKPGELPVYAAGALEEEAMEKAMAEEGGQQKKLPVVLSDGRFLCASADGSRKLFSRTTLEQEEGTASWKEEFVLLDQDGKQQELTLLQDVYAADQAAFSPDGNRIAVLEGGRESISLYCCDLEEKELINLSESGLGNNVSDFVWADDHTLYVLADQLKVCDLSKPESEMISTLEEVKLNSGSIGFANGRVYYSDAIIGGSNQIYSIQPGGTSEKFSPGTRFSIDQAGKNMAIVLDQNEAESEEVRTALAIQNLSSGQRSEIANNVPFSGISWSPSGNKLFYTISTDSPSFPNKLYSYDTKTGKSVELMDLLSSDIHALDDTTLYVVQPIGDGTYSATYELDLK